MDSVFWITLFFIVFKGWNPKHLEAKEAVSQVGAGLRLCQSEVWTSDFFHVCLEMHFNKSAFSSVESSPSSFLSTSQVVAGNQVDNLRYKHSSTDGQGGPFERGGGRGHEQSGALQGRKFNFSLQVQSRALCRNVTTDPHSCYNLLRFPNQILQTTKPGGSSSRMASGRCETRGSSKPTCWRTQMRGNAPSALCTFLHGAFSGWLAAVLCCCSASEQEVQSHVLPSTSPPIKQQEHPWLIQSRAASSLYQ